MSATCLDVCTKKFTLWISKSFYHGRCDSAPKKPIAQKSEDSRNILSIQKCRKIKALDIPCSTSPYFRLPFETSFNLSWNPSYCCGFISDLSIGPSYQCLPFKCFTSFVISLSTTLVGFFIFNPLSINCLNSILFTSWPGVSAVPAGQNVSCGN